jgi:hypothetical protein
MLVIFAAAVVAAFVGSHGVASVGITVAIVIAFFAIGGAALRLGGVVRAQLARTDDRRRTPAALAMSPPPSVDVQVDPEQEQWPEHDGQQRRRDRLDRVDVIQVVVRRGQQYSYDQPHHG